MSNIRNEIVRMDKMQMESLLEYLQERIREKREEEKRTVWRVCDKYLCLGNFREDEYLKAAEFLLEKAKEMSNDHSLTDKERQLDLVAERVPASEYEEYING